MIQKDGYSFEMDISTSQLHWYSSTYNAIIGMSREMNPQNTAISSSGTTITYAGAWVNTDLQYSTSVDTIKETLIIQAVSHWTSSIVPDYLQYVANCYYTNTLTIVSDGISYLHPTNQKFTTSGEITFNDPNGKMVFALPVPYVYDSASPTPNMVLGTYAVTANNGILIINIRIPKSFMDAVTYPVYFDPPVRVQGNARGTSTTSPISVTMASTPASGNVLVAIIGTEYSGGYRTVSSISETNVVWAKQISQSGQTYYNIEIWFGTVGVDASKSVTINLSGNPDYGSTADICEYSGIATSSFLDKTATNTGNSIYPDTGTTVDTTQANELWVGGTVNGNYKPSTPTDGFTLLDGNLSTYMYLTYLEKIVSATGAAHSSVTLSSARGWAGCIATFKAAAPANTAPTNDACDSTATFDYDVLGWINMTVTDVDLVADLYTVQITITTSDSKTSVYLWTQSTGVFSESSDPNGISSIDAGSVRVNIDADTDKIAFKIKFTQVPALGNCNVQAITTDDASASDTDTYTAEFRLIFSYKAAAQSLTLTKSAARLIEVSKAGTKSLTVTDSAARLLDASRATAQSLTLAEAVIIIAERGRAAAITIATSLSATKLIEVAKAATQSITFGNVASKLSEFTRAASQAITGAFSTAKILEYTRTAVQSISGAFSANRLIEVGKSIAQTLSFSGSASKLVEMIRQATQSLGLSSAATRLGEFLRAASQGISVISSTTRFLEWLRAATQGITIGNSASKLFEIVRSVTQSLTLTNVASKLFDITRTATQGLTIGNAATRLMEALRSATQGITFTSTGARLFESLRAAAQTLNLSSAASRLIDITRQVAQSLMFGLSTLAEKVASYIRSASLTITTSLSATRLIDILKNVAQAITLSPAATRLGEWLRIITQGLSFSSTASNLLEWLRVASQSINITSLASKIFDIIRTTSQNIAISLNANRLIEVIKNVAQSITASLSVNRIYDAFRSVTQSITTTFLATKIREVLRSVSQAITSTFNAERLLDALRSISQTLNITNIANAVYEAAIHLFNRAASLALGITSNTVRLREVLAAASIIFTLASGAIGHVLTLFNVAANVVIHLKSWGYLGALGAVVESDTAGLFLMGIVAGFLLVLLLVFLLTEK
jgi:DNA-binding IscR family transcriptional regulator